MKRYVYITIAGACVVAALTLCACKAQRIIKTTAKAVPSVADTMLIETQVVETYDGMIRK